MSLHLWTVAGLAQANSVNAGAAASAQAAAREARDGTQALEDRLDKLTLISMAMWELLKQRGKLSEADLLAKVQELDLRDGVPDGKVTRTARQCPQCDRTMSPRHKKCLYCGSEDLVDSVFDGV